MKIKQVIRVLLLLVSFACLPAHAQTHNHADGEDYLPIPHFGMADKENWLVDQAMKQGPVLAPTYSTRNCVAFLHDLLNPVYSFSLAEKKRIYIKGSAQQARKLLREGDEATVSGVCRVLTDRGLASRVSPDSLQSGDIVQYWYMSYCGDTLGHCGIIGSASHDGGFRLLSSAYSHNGFGIKYVHPAMLIKVFAARPRKDKVTLQGMQAFAWE
ncbi:MAG: hypothetical protein V4543_16215 [Bacteroidota bacterium]